MKYLWRCHSCKTWFREPNRVQTFRGSYWEPEEWEWMCPSCDSDDIEELQRCDNCDEVAEEGSDYCKACDPGEQQ